MQTKHVGLRFYWALTLIVAFAWAGCLAPSGPAADEVQAARQTDGLSAADVDPDVAISMHGCSVGLVSVDADEQSVRNMVPSRYALYTLLGSGQGVSLSTHLRACEEVVLDGAKLGPVLLQRTATLVDVAGVTPDEFQGVFVFELNTSSPELTAWLNANGIPAGRITGTLESFPRLANPLYKMFYESSGDISDGSQVLYEWQGATVEPTWESEWNLRFYFHGEADRPVLKETTNQVQTVQLGAGSATFASDTAFGRGLLGATHSPATVDHYIRQSAFYVFELG